MIIGRHNKTKLGKKGSKKINEGKVILLLVIIASVLAVALLINIMNSNPSNPNNNLFTTTSPNKPPIITNPFQPNKQASGFKRFSSTQEFLRKLSEQGTDYGYYGSTLLKSRGMVETTLQTTSGENIGVGENEVDEVERYSQTNVQVEGIDEPDIVKTDGKNIYYSPHVYGYYFSYYGDNDNLFVIKPLPVDELKVKNKLKTGGELLLTKEDLIILNNKEIVAYDKDKISDEDETIDWRIRLNDSQIITARYYNNKIFLVLRKNLYYYQPRPILPIIPLVRETSTGEKPLVIEPTRIYYPANQNNLNSLYIILKVDADTGNIIGKTTIMLTRDNTNVYMSKNNLYLTTYYQKSGYEIMRDFILENKELFADIVIKEVRKIDSYDISERSKMVELNDILNRYFLMMDRDDYLTLKNKMDNYMTERQKELYRTKIARIDLETLNLEASADLEGKVLNPFSMDEYDDYFRIALTRGRWDNSDNILYILDQSLNVVGSTDNFGTTERIYSVRFINDKAFVVTYREVDPFFIIDLSNPTKPTIKGELKIPGYSSYLHPITNDLILGIGKQGLKVKVSLFDVSNEKKPREVSKFTLNEYWSSILRTHHAFVIDKKHKVFFVPGSRGGYIISYENNNLELKKAISTNNLGSVRRTLYINDYLYLLTRRSIIVVSEETWDRVKELEFK